MTTEMNYIECPADGCDYENKPSSVFAHYSGTADDAHSGGYERARMRYEQANGEVPDDVSTDNEEPPAEPSDGSHDPVKDAPPAEERTDDTDPEDGCPDCGAELIDFRSHETYRTDDGRELDTPDDYYCSGCGKGWNYE